MESVTVWTNDRVPVVSGVVTVPILRAREIPWPRGVAASCLERQMVDRFKTQVMFLHPEPALMEPCASRLGEEFSVHMAASGTEALTTLGITPIDVIVSAQDLPGMTGTEALKEAKRRSPDTRGILVASDYMTDDDRAALVNVKHLNQVLRAQSTPEEICEAIHATLRGESVADLPIPANDSSPGLTASDLSHTGTFASTTGGLRVNPDATGSFRAPNEIPTLQPGGGDITQQALSQVEIVVLTNDGSFLKTIRAAAGSSHVVNHAPNLQDAVNIAQEGTAGVLITDAAVAVKDVETITAQLRKHVPGLVTIVAGRREDGEKMMGLISDGLVYRFLLKPVSPGRSRLAIEASAKKYLTLNATEVPLTPADVQEKMTETGIIKGVTFDSGLFRTTDVRETGVDAPPFDNDLEISDSGLFDRVPPIAWAVLAVAIVGIGWLLMRGGDEAQPATAGTTAAVESSAAQTSAPEPIRDPAILASEALAAGDAARRDGKLVLPADDNAVMHYATAARLQRDAPLPRARLDAVLEDVFAGVESDFLADDLERVSEVLAVLNQYVPSHPRLAFLNRELSREQSRREFSLIEQDLLRSDLDSAERRLDRLAASGAVDDTLLATTRQRISELRAARIEPPVTAAPVQRAPAETTRNDADFASSESPTTGTSNEPVNTGPDVSGLLARANERIDEGNLVTPAGDSARDYFAAALAQDGDNQLAAQGLRIVASMLTNQAQSAIDAGNANTASTLIAQAEIAGADSTAISDLRQSLAALIESSQTAVEEQPAVAAVAAPEEAATAESERSDFELRQIEATPPAYPRSAQRRGITGWVDVEFTVNYDGSTGDATIVESRPGSVFNRAALDAIAQWRYEPLDLSNTEASQRARVRLEFNLED